MKLLDYILDYILDYKKRIIIIDNFLNIFSSNKYEKFYILCFIHYILFFIPCYYIFFFSKNIILFYISFLILFIQFVLNIIDKGCILLKLERKYIGKSWFGIYNIGNLFYPNICDYFNKNINIIFINYIIISICITIYGIYKIIYFNKT